MKERRFVIDVSKSLHHFYILHDTVNKSTTKIHVSYDSARIFVYKKRDVLNVYADYSGPKSIYTLIDVAPDAITAGDDTAEGYNYMTICISYMYVILESEHISITIDGKNSMEIHCNGSHPVIHYIGKPISTFFFHLGTRYLYQEAVKKRYEIDNNRAWTAIYLMTS